MGLDLQNLRAVLAAKACGADWSATATLGRQTLMITPGETEKVFREFSLPADPKVIGKLIAPEFADALLKHLGVTGLESIDTSDYEQADHIQDLNEPLNPVLRERFSLLIDGGSLEHVFNLPQALRNCMEMVRPGGHFMICNVANNFCGHGFYQFSPELFWRVLCPSNGFQIEWMVFAEYGGSENWVRIPDPAVVRSRVSLTNAVPTYLFLLARKTGAVPEPLKPAMQSDYAAVWEEKTRPAHEPTAPPVVKRRRGLLPLGLKIRLRSILAPYKRAGFIPVKAHQLRP